MVVGHTHLPLRSEAEMRCDEPPRPDVREHAGTEPLCGRRQGVLATALPIVEDRQAHGWPAVHVRVRRAVGASADTQCSIDVTGTGGRNRAANRAVAVSAAELEKGGTGWAGEVERAGSRETAPDAEVDAPLARVEVSGVGLLSLHECGRHQEGGETAQRNGQVEKAECSHGTPPIKEMIGAESRSSEARN